MKSNHPHSFQKRSAQKHQLSSKFQLKREKFENFFEVSLRKIKVRKFRKIRKIKIFLLTKIARKKAKLKEIKRGDLISVVIMKCH